MRHLLFQTVLMGTLLASAAQGAEVLVSNNISVSTTWTSDNVYRLQKQVYVLPGATLTIEGGTLVQSTAGVGGSLAVCRGARIYVQGTADAPVIMTSTRDDLKNWHEGANEWGNLTIMGNALVSASHYGGEAVGSNTKTPTGLNVKQMEGLVADFPGDTKVMYGGNNDNDNSGSISYLSLRYGGKVIGLANELNGLSLGGVGRGTDIDHIEVMNNVDDGIEIWGGTVNLKYVNIWNVGDDSFDIDEGWRGKAQFGLIVQGHSADASQGSGVGDNCFEVDGAEDSDAQPVTTGKIYNFTVVGQPLDGDGGTTWRDNARMQYRNCIFMELGEKLVRFDDDDGDGANGYGYNGTLTWEQTWTTPYSQTSSVNAGSWTAGAFNDPAVMYQAQTDGMLAEIRDSVFYRNEHAEAYTEAQARGVLAANMNNVVVNNEAKMPIRTLRRKAMVEKGGKNILPVKSIDPRPANAALESMDSAPDDGFFTPAAYRGGFEPGRNWLNGWSAVAAYGMIEGEDDPTPTPTPVATPTPTEPTPTIGPFDDADGDGRGDLCETDDLDLLLAADATITNILLPDSDSDGLLDGQEDPGDCANQITPLAMTNPRKKDTDGDGFSDGLEVLILGSDPLDAASPADATDADGDGLPASIDPDDNNIDTDGDGFGDAFEVVMGSDPEDAGSVPALGDVNGDGKTHNIDAIIIFNYSLGNVPVEASPTIGNGDVQTSGHINNLDGIVLFNWTLGNVPAIPVD